MRKPVGSFEECDAYSIDDARAIEGQWRVSKKENRTRIFNIQSDRKMTFKELTKWYMDLEKVKALSSYWRLKISLDKFNAVFGNKIINRIKMADLEHYQAKRKAEGRADNSIDREIRATKTTVFKAFDNNMLNGVALKAFKKAKKMVKRRMRVPGKGFYGVSDGT